MYGFTNYVTWAFNNFVLCSPDLLEKIEKSRREEIVTILRGVLDDLIEELKPGLARDFLEYAITQVNLDELADAYLE